MGLIVLNHVVMGPFISLDSLLLLRGIKHKVNNNAHLGNV